MKQLKIPGFIWYVLILGFGYIISGCNSNSSIQPLNTTAYPFPEIPWFPTKMNIPADNPTTIEGVRLGRYLYYDSRWTGRFDCDSQMSCATCHKQSRSFVCGIDHPKFTGGHPFGVTGIKTPHYMLPHVNLVYNFNGYTWNGLFNENNNDYGSAAFGVPARAPFNYKNLEGVVWVVLYLHEEVYSDSAKALAALNSIQYPDYKKLFKAAFGTEVIRMELIDKAIAQFIRTLISYNSKYDSVVNLHRARFTPSEARGFQVFMTEKGDCFHCHGDPALLTNNLFLNNGLDSVFNDPNDRFHYTHDSSDIGAYKVPTLRNIALRGPYMRDGRFKTLEEVIEFYSSGLKATKYTNPLMKKAFQGGLQLNSGEKQDLLNFLYTLTDYKFISDTAFSKPSDLYTGCP